MIRSSPARSTCSSRCLGKGIPGIELRAEQDAIELFQLLDGIRPEPLALQSDRVNAINPGVIPRSPTVLI